MTHNDRMAAAALAYARMGLAVLPLHSIENGICTCGRSDCRSPGKHPRNENGSRDATWDENTIRQWWQQWPGSNIGIATGAAHGLVVIDIDPDHEGMEYFPDLTERLGQLPGTWEAITGSLGRHIYLRLPDGLIIKNKSNWVQGVDVRGEGGYVVAPPSSHLSGRQYAWEASSRPIEVPMADIPEAWLDELSADKPADSKKAAEIPDQIQEGERNNLLFRLASSLRARGLSQAGILAALTVENQERCNPPLSDAEVAVIAKSASRYEQGEVRTTPAPAVAPNSVGKLPEDLSDIGNARIFVDLFREKLYHVYPWGWTAWDGTRWALNSDHIAIDAAMTMAEKLLDTAIQKLDDAAKAEGEDGESSQAQAKKFYSHACKSRQLPRLRTAIDLAAPGLYEDADVFNKNPYDLNTPAGIVDLQTGAMRSHDPAARCTMITDVAPDSVPSPMFTQFLKTITCRNWELEGYLQQVADMAAVGKVFMEGLVICHGGGSNGKSTFLNLLTRVLGDYACSISPEVLMAQRAGQQPQGMAAVRGKRLVIAQETEEGKRLAVSAVKQLSSTDKIVAKRLYKDPEEFAPTHTLIMSTNFLPKVGSVDTGTWRRLIVVPFDNTIPDSEKRTNFLEELYTTEAPAVLQWIIEGARKFIENDHKVDVPEVVKKATDQYRSAENWVQNFIIECCETGENYREKGGRLYETYRTWAQTNGEYTCRSTDFAAAMEAAGFSKRRTMNGSEWTGIRVAAISSSRVYSGGGGSYDSQ